MRIIRFLTIAALIALPAVAASAEEYGRSRDWRLLGFSRFGESAEYIDAGSIGVGERGTRFAVLTVYRRPQPGEYGDHDARLLLYSVDCATRTYWLESDQSWSGGLQGPPAILGMDPRAAPPAGTLLDMQIRTACGLRALSPERVSHPDRIWDGDQDGRGRADR